MLNRELNTASLRQQFHEAQPFPHLVLDDLFPQPLLETINVEFDDMKEAAMERQTGSLQRKLGSKPDVDLPEITQAYFNFIYSGPFTRMLSDITGIPNLIPDPSLYGGGMHEMPQGGCFHVHTDFNKHPRTKLDNRLVLITYLNHDWQESYGGALELWQQEPPSREVSILPEFGRTLLFAQSPRAAHGLPQPVATPTGRGRRSVTAYYYTNGGAESEPGVDTKYNAVTTKYLYYRNMPARQKFELAVRQTVPPIALTALTALQRRFKRG